MAAVAEAHPDQVVMEAFHYRYHPFAERLRSIVASGELGTIRRVDTSMCIPLPLFNGHPLRLRALAGGASMDVGCYAVHVLRLLAGEEPEVVSATAKLQKPHIDRQSPRKLFDQTHRCLGRWFQWGSRNWSFIDERVVSTI